MKILVTIFLFFVSLVSNATDYYFDFTGGDNSNSGSQASPFKTLAKLSSLTLNPGDRLFLKRGETWNETLTIPNSGSIGNPIVVGAYGTGVLPKISGFTTLTSWSSAGGGIYTKSITGSPSTVNVVLLDNVFYAKGRTPANDYYQYQSHSGNTSITSNAISGVASHTGGGEVVIRKNDFTVGQHPVTNQTSTTVTYSNSGLDYATPTNNYRFFFQNKATDCLTLGQWYYNSGTLGMQFAAGNPTSYTIKASTIQNLVDIDNKDYITFQDIEFEGANKNVFYGNENDSIIIKRCTASNIGQSFYYNPNSVTGTNRVAIDSCNLTNILYNGVNYYGATRLTFTNNIVDKIGYYIGNGEIPDGDRYGSTTSYPGLKFRAEYNTITNCGKNGLTFFGDSATIQYNYINTFSLAVSDGGGIYCWNGTDLMPNGGHQINYNIVVNGFGEALGTPDTSLHRSFGIYIDDNTVHATITRNTMANNAETNFYIHNSRYITAQYNTCYLGGDYAVQWTDDGGYGGISNLNYQYNEYYQETPSPWIVSMTDVTNSVTTWGTINNNKYIYSNNDNIAGYIIHNALATDTYSQWKTYTGKDVNSTNVTPAYVTGSNDSLFINPTNATVNISSAYKWKDLNNTIYDGVIPLSPYQGLLLFNIGSATTVITNFILKGRIIIN